MLTHTHSISINTEPTIYYALGNKRNGRELNRWICLHCGSS